MFTLKIPVTRRHIEALKACLTRALPHVKSSHRCEALARGLGFGTHAAHIAAAKNHVPVFAEASGAAFSAYLATHGFAVSPRSFYHVVARVALRTAVETMPALTVNGIGMPPVKRFPGEQYPEYISRKNALLQEEHRRFAESGSPTGFLLSLAFLDRVEKTKTVRPGTSSYYLKHIAEKYYYSDPNGDTLGPEYISNGVFIAAAIHAGFEVETYYGDLNAQFNMSKRCLNELDCEIRPNGPRGQDRRRREERRNMKAQNIWMPA